MIPQIILSHKNDVNDLITLALDTKDGSIYEISIINETDKLYFAGKISYSELVETLLKFTEIIAYKESEE